MANVNISEYPHVGVAGSFAAQIGSLPPLVAPQNLTPTGTSAQSAAFTDNTRIIRVFTDTAIAIRVSDALTVAPFGPVAVSTDTRMAANATEYFAVAPGQKAAVIT